MVRGPEGAAAAAESLGGFEHGLYAEQWAPYVKVRACAVSILLSSRHICLESFTPPARLFTGGLTATNHFSFRQIVTIQDVVHYHRTHC